MTTFSRYIPDEISMLRFGQRLADAVRATAEQIPLAFYLNGDLGAGKTLLSRGIIQAFGHTGKVKSPTYTLVEEYPLAEKRLYHFDLYRLSDPEELEFMGIRDYFTADSLCLVEWAEKGQGILPPADLSIDISYVDDARQLDITAHSPAGVKLIDYLNRQH